MNSFKSADIERLTQLCHSEGLAQIPLEMANEPHKIDMRFHSANCLTSKNHVLVITSAGMSEMGAFGSIFEENNRSVEKI